MSGDNNGENIGCGLIILAVIVLLVGSSLVSAYRERTETIKIEQQKNTQ